MSYSIEMGFSMRNAYGTRASATAGHGRALQAGYDDLEMIGLAHLYSAL